MTRSVPFLALLSALLLPLAAPAQESERRNMLEKAGPSVVAIRNDESYGSGMILDEQGTILTNAHVIVSPLPLRVEAQWRAKEGLRSGWFSKVVLIGVHPKRDLALLRIDPSEHQAKLTPLPIAKSKAVSRDSILAIGFPDTYGGTQKTCTLGEVTGVDKFVDMPGYFEFSAEVHHGNSGGPIVDTFGHAVGIVTAGRTDGEPVAWAIPLWDLRPDQFVPLDRRPRDPAKASAILRFAEDLLRKAREGKRGTAAVAGMLFQMALLEDISNADTYFKVGALQRHYQSFGPAAAYLMRSIQIQPWNDSKDIVYHELGVALAQLRRPNDAITVWNEGVAKYPGEAPRVWDALAVHHFEQGRFLDAACASRASLRAFGDRAQAMNEVYDRARKRLDGGEIARLTAFEQGLDAGVQDSRKVADRARQDGKRFLTPECETLVKSFEGVQKEAAGFNFSSLGRGPNAPKPIEIPDAELLPLFIKSRIAVAGEHLQAGRIKLATEVLEDVIKTYPDHPDTESARELLGLINKKK
ncbi:MAG: trypsin-like peptidase domain-containing protein [Planctomycetes bacterium]|nr:trypsin-like peptidase domain-containing protein [Planctomycetota bacterium]